MRKTLEKEKLEDLEREINDGKVLMWGVALDQTQFPGEKWKGDRRRQQRWGCGGPSPAGRI